MSEDLTMLTISQAAKLIEKREVSPVALTDAYLARIERLNPAINAYVTITADLARTGAREAEAEIARSAYRGPLHGIPIGLKDLYDTAGIETAGGSKILKGRVPQRDSTCARKLNEAGAVLLGKTNTHEFAWGATTNNPHTGPTHNPWKLDRIPGGSSGGSGAAIAARMAAGTLGTDTGGSIRIPAAMCGCVGLKPTFGRVSKAGVLPMSWQFDHPGPIVKCVEDAAIILNAIAGYDAADFATVPVPVPDYREGLDRGIQGMRIGVPREQFFGLVDPELRVSVEEAIETLRGLGAEVFDVDAGFSRESLMQAWVVCNAEGQAFHAEWLRTRKQDYGADLQASLSLPLPDAVGLADAYRASYDIKEALRQTFERVDLLVTPATMRPASVIGDEELDVNGHKMGTGAAFASMTMPFNIAGLPAITLPCGLSSDGLPLSLQLAGGPFHESTVLRAARAFESAQARSGSNIGYPPDD
jgi:aspartyl-tRNA(Asn)/glutamyl-tRNA(Gln) amidotransferase subunit A